MIEGVIITMGTKERILLTSLRLFARDGYEAVSVSMIASELGMVKSALYKHYKSKRAIFDSIVNRMRNMDYENAIENGMPEKTYCETPYAYSNIRIDDVKPFTIAMFTHWTQVEFPSLFRKMLTIEQYHNSEMSKLYEQYLSSSPLTYVEDIFAGITGDKENSKLLALRFYAPMYMLYGLYDTESDKEAVNRMLLKHIDHFIAELKKKYGLE